MAALAVSVPQHGSLSQNQYRNCTLFLEKCRLYSGNFDTRPFANSKNRKSNANEERPSSLPVRRNTAVRTLLGELRTRLDC